MDILEILKQCNKKMNNAETEEEQVKVVEPLGQLLNSFLEELKHESEKSYLRLSVQRQYNQIIKPNVNIGDSECSLVHFFLDDIEIYRDFMEYLVDYFVFSDSHEFTFNQLILATQKFIMETFGPLGDPNRLYGYFCQREDEHVSIKDLYKKNLAVCIERAAFAHNLLQLLGLDATIINCELFFNNNQLGIFEGHVVNVVRNNNEFYIIDFMNCSKNYFYAVHDGRKCLGIKDITPTIIKLTEQEYDEFLNNKKNIEYDLIEKHLDKNREQTTHCILQSHVFLKTVSEENYKTL